MTQTLASITLLVREYEEAIAYYTQKLGFALVENTPLTDDKRWVRIALPGSSHVTLLLARASTPVQLARVGDQAGGRVFLFLQTNDFWQDHQAMRARGVRFVEEPRVEWYGTVAVFQDLYGNRWDLVQAAPQTPPRAS
jgi:catechol 2,3-dioxygenase-like lactoylglutathione lyase family enzyme